MIENKVRDIVAEMLVNMDDKLSRVYRELHNCQNHLQKVDLKVAESNHRLERISKIQDIVSQLKNRISSMVSYNKRFSIIISSNVTVYFWDIRKEVWPLT